MLNYFSFYVVLFWLTPPSTDLEKRQRVLLYNTCTDSYLVNFRLRLKNHTCIYKHTQHQQAANDSPTLPQVNPTFLSVNNDR